MIGLDAFDRVLLLQRLPPLHCALRLLQLLGVLFFLLVVDHHLHVVAVRAHVEGGIVAHLRYGNIVRWFLWSS